MSAKYGVTGALSMQSQAAAAQRYRETAAALLFGVGLAAVYFAEKGRVPMGSEDGNRREKC